MMTVAAIMRGCSRSCGPPAQADVMKRIAAPMIGGMVSSTILTLIVIPILYFIWKRWIMRSESQIDRTVASPTSSEPW